jgi:hypothetical protein
MNPDSKYLVIDNHVRQNAKTKEHSLQITMLDLNASSSDEAIVTLKAHVYEETNRNAQTHEIDRAVSTIKRDVKNSWVYPLTEES